MIKNKEEDNDIEGRKLGWSFSNKHILNNVVSRWKKNQIDKPPKILETCQERGIGSRQYRRYGPVIAFEKDPETYWKMRQYLRKHSENLVSLEKGLDNLDHITKLYPRKFPIIIPSKPTDSTSGRGMSMLIDNEVRFHILDIDPYGSPNDFFPKAFKLLSFGSLLFVTVGDMHRHYEGYENVMDEYSISSNGSKFKTRIFREDCALYIGAWLMGKGLDLNIGLLPIFVHDYYFGGSGVQRLCFYTERSWNLSQKSELTRQCLQRDSSLETEMIICEDLIKIEEGKVVQKNQSSGGRSAVRILDTSDEVMTNPTRKEVGDLIKRRLNFLAG